MKKKNLQYHASERFVSPRPRAILHPLQTPQTTTTVRSSPTSERIRSSSSTGRSFQPCITTIDLSTFSWPPPATIRLLKHTSKFTVSGFPPPISAVNQPAREHQSKNQKTATAKLKTLFIYSPPKFPTQFKLTNESTRNKHSKAR